MKLFRGRKDICECQQGTTAQGWVRVISTQVLASSPSYRGPDIKKNGHYRLTITHPVLVLMNGKFALGKYSEVQENCGVYLLSPL